MYLRENITRTFPILTTKWDISIQPIGQMRYIKDNRITLLLFSFEYVNMGMQSLQGMNQSNCILAEKY